MNVSGGPDSLVGLQPGADANGSGQATFDLRPDPNYTITSSTTPVGATSPVLATVSAAPTVTALTVTYIVSGSGACP